MIYSEAELTLNVVKEFIDGKQIDLIVTSNSGTTMRTYEVEYNVNGSTKFVRMVAPLDRVNVYDYDYARNRMYTNSYHNIDTLVIALFTVAGLPAIAKQLV